MISLEDLQVQLGISSDLLDDTLDYLDIYSINDLIFEDDAERVQQAIEEGDAL